VALPPRSQLLGLASAENGPVDAVWYRYGVHSAPELSYAGLRPDGTLGPTVTVAHLGSPVSQIQFAINDHGATAASWVNGPNSLDPRHPHAVPLVRAELCTAQRCGPTQTLSLGPPRPQFINTAITLSDNGTATVLAGGQQEALKPGSPIPIPIETGPHGLWAAVSRHGRFTAASEISATGNFPIATADGTSGALAAFNVGTPPIDTIAYATLPPTATRFTPATSITNHQTDNSPVVAANLNDTFITAWLDSEQGTLRTALGSGEVLTAPATIAPASDHPAVESFAVGIDSHGNAIVIWDDTPADGYTHGVFAAFHHA
jgi:hypothetical protein